VARALTPGVKRPELEADHSLPSGTELIMHETIPPLPEYVFMAWRLVKHRDNFIFTVTVDNI
jgi:hypothetical protein